MQTMESIFTNLKNTFRAGNILAKLIYINVGLFILIRLMGVIFLLFNIPGISFLQYLQMPSSPELLMYRPWTVITYMFTHFDFLHILFNIAFACFLYLSVFSDGGFFKLSDGGFGFGDGNSFCRIVLPERSGDKSVPDRTDQVDLSGTLHFCDRPAGYYFRECRRAYCTYWRCLIRYLVCHAD